MRVGAVREGLDVALQRVDGDAVGLRALHQQLGVVDTLCAGHHLLAADEDIEGVGELLRLRHTHRHYGVVRVGHGVEGAHGERELVEDVEVGVVLLLDDAAQLLLHRRAAPHTPPAPSPHVAHRVHVEAVVDQQLHRLRVRQHQRLARVHQRREGVLRLRLTHSVKEHVDSGELLSEARIESVEDVDEHVGDEVERLVVVLLDGHLHVQPGELAQVAVRVAVLRAEHGADLEHALEVRARRAHLLVQLRRLCQTRLLTEVVQPASHPIASPSLEHVGTALGGAGVDLGRVQLDKVLADEELAEEQAHGAADADDRLVARRAQVQPAIVQTRVGVDRDELAVLLRQRLVRGDLRVRAHGRLQLEGQLHLHARNHEDATHGDLDVLEGRGVDRRLHLLDGAVDVDDALLGDLARVVHHRLRNLVALEQAALHGVHVLAEDDEAALALVVHVEGAAADQHLLADVLVDLVQATRHRLEKRRTGSTCGPSLPRTGRWGSRRTGRSQGQCRSQRPSAPRLSSSCAIPSWKGRLPRGESGESGQPSSPWASSPPRGE